MLPHVTDRVRAKAMSNFAHLCTSYNKWLIKEIVTPSTLRRPSRSRVFRTPGKDGPFPMFPLNGGLISNREVSVAYKAVFGTEAGP